MGRDSGKGKAGGRGKGKKMFIENMDELTIREREITEQRDARAKRRAGSDDEGDEDAAEDAAEDTDQNVEGKKTAATSEDAAASVFQFERKTRAEYLKETQSKGKDVIADGDSEEEEEEEDSYRGLAPKMPKTHNPNHLPKGPEKMLKAKDLNDPTIIADPEAGMNRKEKEALSALRAKEEYQRRHMAGETEQAKRELAKLAEVRARREAARLKREAEGRKPGMSATGLSDDFELDKAKGKADSDDDDDDDDSDDSDEEDNRGKGPPRAKAPAAPPAPLSSSAALAAKKKAAAAEPAANPASSTAGPAKLKAMDIKKMNGDALKEHLKERKLDVQGQKKDLMKRLIDYEEARS